jgi:hypothetical protein
MSYYERVTVPAPLTKEQERNAYFHFHTDRVELSPLTRGKHLAHLATKGCLLNMDMEPLTHGFMIDTYELRTVFCKYASWAIYTQEYLDSLAEMVKGYRVVEVGAGRGLLQPLMQERGIDWLSTDRRPPVRLPGQPYVMKRGWQRALKVKWGAELVFASWWPYEDDDDVRLAQVCADRNIPLIVVGEDSYGCTGSKKFWSSEQDWKVLSMPEHFEDLPSWSGIHDYTYVALPKKAKPQDFFPSW